METTQLKNDSSIVVAIVLDDMGLARWMLRMHSLPIVQVDYEKILAALKNALSFADEKYMENGAGVLWTWNRTAWESLDSSWTRILREEVRRIPQENCTILGNSYWWKLYRPIRKA